jgi:hypothetical protein
MLLALASLFAGCAQTTGDFGRPRSFIFEAWFAERDPTRTNAEAELDSRLWRFRRSPAVLPTHSPSARFNALRDEIEADRQLIPPLALAFSAAIEKQANRTAAMMGLDHAEADAREDGVARIQRHRAIGAEICPLLMVRIATYRASLESQVVRGPEVEASAAERSLMALANETAAVCPSVPHEAGAVPPTSPMPIRK